MQFDLLNNAVDSLKSGIGFYKKYINVKDHYESGFGYLKSTVIYLHHATELIIKRLLSEINELLIISDINEKGFLELYTEIISLREIYNRKKRPIYYYLSGERNIHTINYSSAVDKYCQLNKLKYEDRNYLINIGIYRNRLMHIGIDKAIDFCDVLICINGTLQLLKTLLPKITPYYKDEKKCLSGVDDRIEDVLIKAQPLAKKYWETYWNECFEDMENCFNDLEKDEKFCSFLVKNKLRMNIECEEYYPSTSFKFIFYNLNSDVKYEVVTENIEKYSATIFKSITEEKIWAIYEHKYIQDHDNKTTNFVILKESPENIDGMFWNQFDKKNKEQIRFSKEQFKRIMINFINEYILNFYIENR